jgi:hypothetical protein
MIADFNWSMIAGCKFAAILKKEGMEASRCPDHRADNPAQPQDHEGKGVQILGGPDRRGGVERGRQLRRPYSS